MYSDFKSSVPIRTLLSFQAERLEDPVLKEAVAAGRYGMATSLKWIRSTCLATDALMPDICKLLAGANKEWLLMGDDERKVYSLSAVEQISFNDFNPDIHPYLSLLTELTARHDKYYYRDWNTHTPRNLSYLAGDLDMVNAELYAESEVTSKKMGDHFKLYEEGDFAELIKHMEIGRPDAYYGSQVWLFFFGLKGIIDVAQLVEEHMVDDWLQVWGLWMNMRERLKLIPELN